MKTPRAIIFGQSRARWARRLASLAAGLLFAQQAGAWPDLRITKSGPSQAAPGDVLTYTLRYTNAGPVRSTAVVMKDFLPANVTALTNTLNGGSLSGGTVSWSLGNVNSRASGVRTFQVRVNVGAPAPGTLTNRAQIFGKEAEESGRTKDNHATFLTTLTNSNSAPTARNDAYTVAEDEVLNVPAAGVLANDSDPEGDALTAILSSGPAHGTLTLNANGGFTYVPNTNFDGADTFTYRASDGTAHSGIATVCITVEPANDPPLARNDAYATPEDTTLEIAAPGVLANDSDADNDPLTALLVSPATNGVVSLDPDGRLTYIPNPNFNGVDGFTYRASDGIDQSSPASVTITVTGVNDPPVARNDQYATPQATTLLVSAPGVLGNDSDPDGDVLTAGLVNGPANGQLTLNANGSFDYRPNTNFLGTDSFVYRAEDGQAHSSNALVTILVFRPNHAPVARDDQYATLEDTPLPIAAPGILANDSDDDGDPLTAQFVTLPANGTLSPNADGGFVYVPNLNFNGVDTFTYRAHDGFTNSSLATATIVVTSANDAPLAQNDEYSIPEDTVLTASAPGILGNDSDPEGGVLSAVLVAGVSHGSLTLTSDGAFTYLPNTNFTGVDVFTYRASDGLTNSELATVTITVTGTNDAPFARDDSYTTLEDTPLVVAAPGVLLNDGDPDGDPLSALLVTGPTHGLVTLEPTGSFTYTPNTNFFGPDSFTYRARDGQSDSSPATVTIEVTPANEPPDTNNWSGKSFVVLEDTLLTIPPPGVLRGLLDVHSNILTAALVTRLAHGAMDLQADGSFNLRPFTNFNGADRFEFAVLYGQTNRLNLTVDITVLPVNDPPSFTKGGNLRLPHNAGPQSISNWATGISPGPADESGQAVTFEVSSDNGGLFATPPAISPEGRLIFTPATGASGAANVTARAHDDGGTADGGVDTSPAQTFTITLNSPPTVQLVSPPNGSTFIAPATFTVLADARDVDGMVTNVSFYSGTNHTAAVASEPFLTVLTNLPVGNYTFGARATDDFGDSANATPITVTVLERPPLTYLTSVYYNPQKDFFEQRVRVTNPTGSVLDAVRVLVFNLTNTPPITVGNRSGFSNDIPYVQSTAPIPPGGFVDFTIEYLSPLRIPPNPILQAELVPPATPRSLSSGTLQPINRGVMLANRTFLVEFNALSNRVYAVEYSEDLVTWKSAQPLVVGEGVWVQWIDNGEPKTHGSPGTVPSRFYRLRLLP